MNASVQPILKRYITRLLDEELAAGGYTGELLVMNGNGGTVSAKQVVREARRRLCQGQHPE